MTSAYPSGKRSIRARKGMPRASQGSPIRAMLRIRALLAHDVVDILLEFVERVRNGDASHRDLRALDSQQLLNVRPLRHPGAFLGDLQILEQGGCVGERLDDLGI